MELLKIINSKLLSKVYYKMTDSSAPLIKNPFVCNSAAQVRMSLDKDPRVTKGNTSFCNEVLTKNGNTHMINQLDDKLSFCFGTAEEAGQEYTDIANYDYELSAETLNNLRSNDKVTHTSAIPISFIQIDNELDGIEWYKLNHPKIPDDLLPIIARYHWGEPITKKSVKNEKKKIQKKMGKQGLTLINKNVELRFD
tara:strand:+ start:1178 stop:1765 length:588 start_codon:yes stop_codon:yes gene_type:complete